MLFHFSSENTKYLCTYKPLVTRMLRQGQSRREYTKVSKHHRNTSIPFELIEISMLYFHQLIVILCVTIVLMLYENVLPSFVNEVKGSNFYCLQINRSLSCDTALVRYYQNCPTVCHKIGFDKYLQNKRFSHLSHCQKRRNHCHLP